MACRRGVRDAASRRSGAVSNMVAASQRALGLAAAICALLLAAAPSAAAQASPDSAPGPVAPYQAPLAPAAGPALPPAQAAVATIGTSGLPSWGTFLKAADADGVQQRVGVLTLTQDRAGKMFFNTTFTADVGPGNPVQSVLVSLPPFINSTAATLAVLYFNATQQARQSWCSRRTCAACILGTLSAAEPVLLLFTRCRST